MDWQLLLQQMQSGQVKALARVISLVENEVEGYEWLMQQLAPTPTRVIGITGPPGAGKSTLTDGLIEVLVKSGKTVAVVCVDPSSPFNLGALLGDRIRMSAWYNQPQVFIRSMATRGSLGGLHPKIIEITDVLKAANFDFIIVETVGVGQSEVEIAGLADVTVVVLVPEAGDEVQTMKAGLMEIADIFVVNKADRPEADTFVKNLRQMLAPAFSSHYQEVPVVKTVAATQQGLAELAAIILNTLQKSHTTDRTFWLLAEKAYFLIEQDRMKDIDKVELKKDIEAIYKRGYFNLYRFIAEKRKKETII